MTSKAFECARYARKLRAPLLRLAETFPEGTTIDQFSVLYALETEGENIGSQLDICKLTNIDRSTVADVVKRLHVRGLIDVKTSDVDRRRNHPKINRAGRALLNKCLKAEEKFLQSNSL